MSCGTCTLRSPISRKVFGSKPVSTSFFHSASCGHRISFHPRGISSSGGWYFSGSAAARLSSSEAKCASRNDSASLADRIESEMSCCSYNLAMELWDRRV